MWGDHLDEWGEEYEEIYSYELEEMKEEFVIFMYLFNKYNIKYNRDSIALHLLFLFEGLGDCNCPKGAYEMADIIIISIERRIEFNNCSHPEGKAI